MSTKLPIRSIALFTILFGFAAITYEVSAAQVNKGEKMLEKVSQDGRVAVDDLKWARVAIFDGDVKQAIDLLNQSKEKLAKVEQMAPEMVVTVNSEEKIKGKTVRTQKSTATRDLVPIDADLILAEDFVTNSEKDNKIKKAMST